MQMSAKNASPVPARSYKWREAYKPRLYRGDYFVLKHLTPFITGSLRHYVTQSALVADIGCGGQPMREQIEALGGKYTGIDVEQNQQNTVDIIATITDVPLPDSSVDVILCTEVLEHVSDTYGAFAELARLLKPGGYIILTTPFHYPLHHEPNDFVRLTPYQIRQCAHLSHLQVVSVETFGNELESIATILDGMWAGLRISGYNLPLRALRESSRLLVNSAVLIAETVVGGMLPKRSFTSVACVLRRQHAHS